MGRYAQTKNAAIDLDYTSMTAKRGPLYAQDADVTSTSDKEIEISFREQKINLILTPLMACRQNLSPITGQEKR
jgi:hypothetical protein